MPRRPQNPTSKNPKSKSDSAAAASAAAASKTPATPEASVLKLFNDFTHHPAAMAYKAKSEYFKGLLKEAWLNTDHFVTMWFSTDPNYYLPHGGEKALTEHLEKNPVTTTTFIWDPSLVNDDARENFKTFIKRLNTENPLAKIVLLDINEEVS